MEPTIPLDPVVLVEEPELLVVDKPPFLPTTPNGRLVDNTVLARLRAARGEPELTCIHRLDRLTCGLLLVTRRAATRGAYQRLFQEHRVAKVYRALTAPAEAAAWPVGRTRETVSWIANVRGERGVRCVIGERAPDAAVGAAWRRARTRITHLGGAPADLRDLGGAAAQPCSRWRLEPVTGRTHQLRATMAALGLPILGDDTYPVDRGLDLAGITRRLRLGATELRYVDPLDGLPRRWRRPIRHW